MLHKWEIPTRTEEGGKNVLPDIAASVKEYMARENYTNDQIKQAILDLLQNRSKQGKQELSQQKQELSQQKQEIEYLRRELEKALQKK